MTVETIEPSDEFKRSFDEAAQRVAKEVHQQMTVNPEQRRLSRQQFKRLVKAQRKLDMKRKKRK